MSAHRTLTAGLAGIVLCAVACSDGPSKARGPLPIGATCTGDAQCDGGYCVDVGDRQVCTVRCKRDKKCPAGWSCDKYAGDVDTARRKLCLCSATSEGCDAIDNDCDAQVDDGTGSELGCGAGECVSGSCFCPPELSCGDVCADVLSDPANCGGCGIVCDILNAAPACVAGECTVGVCNAGFGDCYDDVAGCETALTSSTHCGGCDTPCTLEGALETCSSGGCEVLSCYGDRQDCAPETPGCEALDTLAYCGDCNNTCTAEHATNPSCEGHACTYEACDAGYVDCDADAANGCELPELMAGDSLALQSVSSTDVFSPSCGTQGAPEQVIVWTAPATARQEFTIANASGALALAVERGSCTGYPQELACTSDDNADALTVSVPAFEGERLLIVVENTDPTGDLTFEINATTDEQGFCADQRDNDGDGASDCQDSDCSSAFRCTHSCSEDWDDCDGDAQNGCEEPIDTSMNCGACGLSCMPPQGDGECIDRDCVLRGCWESFGDCNNDGRDGCEQPLTTNSHCGACGKPCALPNAKATSCATGACVIVACEQGFANCDGEDSNGCEALNTAENCTACGQSCASVGDESVSCSTGRCEITACAEDALDVDRSRSNGCEAIFIGSVLDYGGTTVGAADALDLGCAVASAPERILWWVAPVTATYTFAGGETLAVGRLIGGWAERICTHEGLTPATLPIAEGTAVAIVVEAGITGDEFALTIAKDEARFCADAIDNDGDSATDCTDSDCTSSAQCAPAGPTGPTGPVPGDEGCPAGYDDCDDDSATACDPLDSATNCLACDLPCDPDHGAGRCTSKGCVITSCEAGFGNCDGNDWNGCETSTLTNVDCRTCGTACLLSNAAATSCATGACEIVTCVDGYDDCDRVDANSCEASLKSADHCGACGRACAPAHVTGYSCATGTCVYDGCVDGWGDCDGDPWNGCEKPISTLNDCGTCGYACIAEQGVPACTDKACTVTCAAEWGNCDGTDLVCETQLNQKDHCGACETTCILPGSVSGCGSGVCEALYCTRGFGNCDGDRENGCEPLNTAENCSDCNKTCAPPNVLESTCEPGTCLIGDCANGFVDCDGSAWSGCEGIDLGSAVGSWSGDPEKATFDLAGACVEDGKPVWLYVWRAPQAGRFAFSVQSASALGLRIAIANCGDLSFDCPAEALQQTAFSVYANTPFLILVEGADSAEAAFDLNITEEQVDDDCPPGYGDCDGDGSCDQPLNTLDHCGQCERACSPPDTVGATCSDGNCSFADCNDDRGNCNGLVGDGCERRLDVADNCGGCNVTCPSSNSDKGYGTCSAGSCGVLGCKADYDDCDDNASNGCETALLSSAAHCGGCGNACTLSHASTGCSDGGCVVTGCDAGHMDCDDVASNGCEVSIKTLEHCGACNVACARPNMVMTCSSGTCEPRGCASDYADCDNNASNGCEPLDTATDCGSCENSCAEGYVCNNGECQLGCTGGSAACDGMCVNLRNDPDHCGACASPCAADEFCSDAECRSVCSGGTTSCGVGIDTLCVDLKSDEQHCGACTNACLAGEVCSVGECALQCTEGTRCAVDDTQKCVDTEHDPDHCGDCDTVCEAGAVCSDSDCDAVCAVGETKCSILDETRCVDTGTSLQHCGGCNRPCASSELCLAGQCLLQCGGGTTVCSATGEQVCVDTGNDPEHCGDCSTNCGALLCSAGQCTTQCESGETECSVNGRDVCVDTSNSPNHCGACNLACDRGTVCSNGFCRLQCNGGTRVCNVNGVDVCVNTSNDPRHCGACEQACPDDQVCTEGACSVQCGGETTACAMGGQTRCIDTTGHPRHCGDCDTPCDNGEVCVDSSCTSQCGPGTTQCDAECVDLDNDPENCGTCGGTCQVPHATNVCVDGVCDIAGCDDNYDECPGGTEGCEALGSSSNCGACGNDCTAFANVSAGTCVPCGVGECFECEIACDLDYGNCNDDAADGCEVNLANHEGSGPCGSCTATCDLANATERCENKTCKLVGCDLGYDNSDQNGDNGCEPLAEPNDCGSATLCSLPNAEAECNVTAKRCEVEECKNGFFNCDEEQANGCEIVDLGHHTGRFEGNVSTDGALDSYLCGASSQSPETHMVWWLPDDVLAGTSYSIGVEADFWAVLCVGRGGCPNPIFDCFSDGEEAIVSGDPGEQIVIVVERCDNAPGEFDLTIEAPDPADREIGLWVDQLYDANGTSENNDTNGSSPTLLETNGTAVCQDGLDNDGDGNIDCNDYGCSVDPNCMCSQNEVPCPAEGGSGGGGGIGQPPGPSGPSGGPGPGGDSSDCNNTLDDDNDSYVDCVDPDCWVRSACQDIAPCPDGATNTCGGPEDCSDGADNNGDGRTDCRDEQCQFATLCQPEDCANDADENGNNLVDCDDPACAGIAPCSLVCPEVDLWAVINERYPLGGIPNPDGFVAYEGMLTNEPSYFSGFCGANGSEKTFALHVPQLLGTPAVWTFETFGFQLQTIVYVMRGVTGSACVDAAVPFGWCSQPSNNANVSMLLEANETVVVVVDSPTLNDTGFYSLRVSVHEQGPYGNNKNMCDDGIDNDGDGKTDCADSDCAGYVSSALKDVQHCGACGNACELAHAQGTCATGVCERVGLCELPYGDCQADSPDCETELTTPSDCGGCGVVCDAGASCDQVGTDYYSCQSHCTGPWRNCDQDLSAKCETDTSNNVSACGPSCTNCKDCVLRCGIGAEPSSECRKNCERENETMMCNNGSCEYCLEGSDRCDGICRSLNTDEYCGSCDNSCSATQDCVDGQCRSNCSDDAVECGGQCCRACCAETCVGDAYSCGSLSNTYAGQDFFWGDRTVTVRSFFGSGERTAYRVSFLESHASAFYCNERIWENADLAAALWKMETIVDLNGVLRLTPPPDADYDLVVWCQGPVNNQMCEKSATSSQRGDGVIDQVAVHEIDSFKHDDGAENTPSSWHTSDSNYPVTCPWPYDDSYFDAHANRLLEVEIVYISGNPCSLWKLDLLSATTGSDVPSLTECR